MGVIGVDASVRAGNYHSVKGHELDNIFDWSIAEGIIPYYIYLLVTLPIVYRICLFVKEI